MTPAGGAHLKLEDRILWEKVARSTKPMQGRMFPSFAAEEVPQAPAMAAESG